MRRNTADLAAGARDEVAGEEHTAAKDSVAAIAIAAVALMEVAVHTAAAWTIGDDVGPGKAVAEGMDAEEDKAVVVDAADTVVASGVHVEYTAALEEGTTVVGVAGLHREMMAVVILAVDTRADFGAAADLHAVAAAVAVGEDSRTVATVLAGLGILQVSAAVTLLTVAPTDTDDAQAELQLEVAMSKPSMGAAAVVSQNQR